MTDFLRRFGRPSDATASAPGRVNLIGEHTDYNGGYVLPIAVPFATTAATALRGDDEVHAYSTTVPAGDAKAVYTRGKESKTGRWIDYVQGLTAALDERGMRVPGFDLLIDSTVPLGGGLASSAALEVSVLRALRMACRLSLDDRELAKTAHRGEMRLVAPVGVMDQMACSLATDQEALFINCRTLETERVAMPADASFAVIDSGIRHRHSTGDYHVRRRECERAAAALGVALLSDLSTSDLPRIAELPPPLDRRARHIVTENARVLAAIDAMRAGALGELGALWTASHESMRDDYDVSLPEIDQIVALALADPRVYGARLTGGGFGGAVIVLTTPASTHAVADRIRSSCLATAGQSVTVLLPANV